MQKSLYVSSRGSEKKPVCTARRFGQCALIVFERIFQKRRAVHSSSLLRAATTMTTHKEILHGVTANLSSLEKKVAVSFWD